MDILVPLMEQLPQEWKMWVSIAFFAWLVVLFVCMFFWEEYRRIRAHMRRMK
jgi:uncharacterized membrane protein